MFGLFSKKKHQVPLDYSLVKTDMHSHLLPGIDDGSPNLETSLAFIRSLKEMGYSQLITTPHIFWDLYKNTPEIILKKRDQVREALLKENINIQLEAAAEYFLDDHFADLLQRKERLLTFGDQYILTEFSLISPSFSMKENLFNAQMAGYQPILAHPERYVYLYKKWNFFHELKENGILLQLNLLSLTGGYGQRVQEMAEYLLQHQLYSLVGTDLHHEGHLRRLETLTIPAPLQDLLTNGQLLNSQL